MSPSFPPPRCRWVRLGPKPVAAMCLRTRATTSPPSPSASARRTGPATMTRCRSHNRLQVLLHLLSKHRPLDILLRNHIYFQPRSMHFRCPIAKSHCNCIVLHLSGTKDCASALAFTSGKSAASVLPLNIPFHQQCWPCYQIGVEHTWLRLIARFVDLSRAVRISKSLFCS